MNRPPVVQKPAAKTNFAVGRKNRISRVTFHHIAGDAPGAIARFQTSAVEVSSHYIIGSDGTIYQCVDENNTAFCDGNADSNSRSISIEHAGGISGVPYTEAMYKASEQLVAYLIEKYAITDFKRHRDVIDKTAFPGGTACPGALDVERIVNNATKLLRGSPMSPGTVDNAYLCLFGRKATTEEHKRWDGTVMDAPDGLFYTGMKNQAEYLRKQVADLSKQNELLGAAASPAMIKLAEAIKELKG